MKVNNHSNQVLPSSPSKRVDDSKSIPVINRLTMMNMKMEMIVGRYGHTHTH